jgi:hypothetical protein
MEVANKEDMTATDEAKIPARWTAMTSRHEKESKSLQSRDVTEADLLGIKANLHAARGSDGKS